MNDAAPLPSDPLKSATIDWKALGQALGMNLQEAATGLIEGAAEDITAYFTGIGVNLAESMQISDPDERARVQKELKGQTLTVLEINRLRLNNAAHDQFTRILAVAVNIANTVIPIALKAVIPVP